MNFDIDPSRGLDVTPAGIEVNFQTDKRMWTEGKAEMEVEIGR